MHGSLIHSTFGSRLSTRRALVFTGSGLQRIACEELITAGFAAEGVTAPEVARDLLMRKAFHLVVLDYEPPGDIDAKALVRELRHNRKAASQRAWIVVCVPEHAIGELRELKNAGVSSVILGQMSLGTLHERLRMMAVDRREFVEADGYVGPDRRVRDANIPLPHDRRDH